MRTRVHFLSESEGETSLHSYGAKIEVLTRINQYIGSTGLRSEFTRSMIIIVVSLFIQLIPLFIGILGLSWSGGPEVQSSEIRPYFPNGVAEMVLPNLKQG